MKEQTSTSSDPHSLNRQPNGQLNGQHPRNDRRRFGCVLTIGLVYASLLAMAIVRGNDALLLAALLINFVIAPILFVVNGVYASRKESLKRPWFSLLFPAGCTLVAIPLLMVLITPYGRCPVNSTCTRIGGWYLAWITMSDVWHFTAVFAIASFLGFGIVWIAQAIIGWIRRPQNASTNSYDDESNPHNHNEAPSR
jgi:hypothetical protein